MTVKTSCLAATFAVVFAANCLACLWDSDTLQMERLRFPGVLEIITGKFVRHSQAYYEWRITDRKKKLESNPGDPALIDDLAVAYAKLGRPEEGIPLLERVFKLPESIKNAMPPPSCFSSQGRRSHSDERTISQRFDGRTMASFAGPVASAGEARQTAHLSAVDPECDLVRQSNWVSVASAAA
jgi:hypothetical protein